MVASAQDRRIPEAALGGGQGRRTDPAPPACVAAASGRRPGTGARGTCQLPAALRVGLCQQVCGRPLSSSPRTVSFPFAFQGFLSCAFLELYFPPLTCSWGQIVLEKVPSWVAWDGLSVGARTRLTRATLEAVWPTRRVPRSPFRQLGSVSGRTLRNCTCRRPGG